MMLTRMLCCSQCAGSLRYDHEVMKTNQSRPLGGFSARPILDELMTSRSRGSNHVHFVDASLRAGGR